MKFCKPFIDCGKGMTVFVTNYGFDIFLQRDEKMIFITQCLVEEIAAQLDAIASEYFGGIDKDEDDE